MYWARSNSPDVWAHFPDRQHADSYKANPAGIEYLFNYYRRDTVTLRVPVKESIGMRAKYVDVVF